MASPLIFVPLTALLRWKESFPFHKRPFGVAMVTRSHQARWDLYLDIEFVSFTETFHLVSGNSVRQSCTAQSIKFYRAYYMLLLLQTSDTVIENAHMDLNILFFTLAHTEHTVWDRNTNAVRDS